jgi:hypothetical protein
MGRLKGMRFVVPALIAALSFAGAAGAAPPPAPSGASGPAQPPPVSPLTVFPKTEAPKLVKSYPAAGAVLPAGVLVLSFTFDQPMAKTGFDLGDAPGADALNCLKTPRLLDDKKTFVLLCTSEPRKSYTLALNAKPQGGFQNEAEHRADPTTLAFKTDNGDGPISVKDAMKAAGLRDIDTPIQDTPKLAPEKATP